MKRVWLVFKILETIFGLCCLGYHARGFLNINFIQDHYTYVGIFGGFSLMAMFGCLSICLKEPVSPLREGLMSIIASITLISVSINSMYHAEKDFHLMYLATVVREEIEEEHRETVDLTQEPHPFFKYSKAQSVAALICGSLFLLHAILAFDLALSDETTVVSEDDESIESEEIIHHMPFFVCGKKMHFWLNRFEWFHILADVPYVRKNGEIIEV